MTEKQEEDKATIELVSFPFDRMTVARFRETFPTARWDDQLQAWKVKGTTARRRLDRWLASEADRRSPYEQERGRDAYAFEPILSPYLDVSDIGFRVRTPFSRTVIDELRQIPLARWNAGDKAWHVPFASYDDLQHRWEAIEEAAKRAEPDERRKRAEARKGTEEEAKAKRRTTERRKRRLPVPSDDLPPLHRPVATQVFGVVVIIDVTGEIVDPSEVLDQYPNADDDHVWALWRLATLEELVHTWPAKAEPRRLDKDRGWWQPTLDELRKARRAAKSRERRVVEGTGEKRK